MFLRTSCRFVPALALASAACLVPGCTPSPTPSVAVEVVPEPATLEEAFARLDPRDPWADLPALNVPVHPAEKYMAGWAIVIDPGHGGHADKPGYKRGPTGVREAEMNLRVAKLLEKMLEDAGAQVVLTRHEDVASSLKERAEIANNLIRERDGGVGADFFMSLHHNASPSPKTNWTSVWFHGDPNDSEVGVDVSRYLGHRVGEALRTQVGVTGILMTDLQMYEGGFGVLRYSNVPSTLGEFSFFSNPEEEQRLRDGLYNLRCAYAIYVAFCEYNYGGRPTQSTPTISPGDDTALLTTTLDDGLPGWWGSDRTRIFRDGVAVTLNGQDLPITFDPATKGLSAELPASMLDTADEHVVKIRHNNFYKHGNWPQRYEIAKDGEQWVVTPLGAQRIDNDAEPGGSLSPAKPRD